MAVETGNSQTPPAQQDKQEKYDCVGVAMPPVKVSTNPGIPLLLSGKIHSATSDSTITVNAWGEGDEQHDIISPFTSVSTVSSSDDVVIAINHGIAPGIRPLRRLIQSSTKAKRTCNPVRNIVDNLVPSNHHGPDKQLISLALGDPTTYGNLACPPQLIDAMIENIRSQAFNGYKPSVGLPEARKALAEHYSFPNNPLSPDVRNKTTTIPYSQSLTVCRAIEVAS